MSGTTCASRHSPRERANAGADWTCGCNLHVKVCGCGVVEGAGALTRCRFAGRESPWDGAGRCTSPGFGVEGGVSPVKSMMSRFCRARGSFAAVVCVNVAIVDDACRDAFSITVLRSNLLKVTKDSIAVGRSGVLILEAPLFFYMRYTLKRAILNH